MAVSEDLDGSYTIIAAGDETIGDETLDVFFHLVGEYDKPATEGTWIENPAHPDGKPIFKKGSLTQPYFIKGETYARSRIAGETAVFKNVEYIRIAIPGDRFSVVDKAADDIYRARFPKQYAAFRAGQDQDAAAGTPLSTMVAMKLLNPAEVSELNYHYIKTVEQLCTVADDKAPVLGFKDLQRKARQFSEAIHAPMSKDEQRKAREEDQARISALEKELVELRKAGKAKAA